jgi:hypothetical protein
MWEYGPNGVNESGSNYGNQLIGWFSPATSGNYVFFTNSDDPSNLYLSTDDNPANKKLIAQETGWSNARNWVSVGSGDVTSKRSDQFGGTEWPNGNVISLQAGRRYYMESLHTEGGGGDSVGATFILEGAADPVNGDAPALAGALIGTYLDPTGATIAISQQPANVNTVANATATFTVAATGSNKYGTALLYQWQKAAAGSTTFTDIPGATAASYTTAALTLANNGEKYRVLVQMLPISETSTEATLTVVQDNIPPTVADLTTDDTFTKITVKFGEPVTAPTATTAGNYALNGGATVSAAALSADGYTVTLTSSKLAEDTDYVLTINNVADRGGNPIAANTTVNFHSWKFTVGKANYIYWSNITGTAVADLTGNAAYPNNPSGSQFLDSFRAPVDWSDNFGAVVTGWFIPPSTGSYVFFGCSDDGGQLWLSTDDKPANKKLIAQETGWSGADNWLGIGGGSLVEEKRSDQFPGTQWPTGNTINLTQGQRYYIEYIYKEGGGGDNGSATYKLASAADPSGQTTIRGDVIGTYAPVVTAKPEFTSIVRNADGSITLTWTGGGTLQVTDNIASGQWQDQAATSPYTFTPQVAQPILFGRIKQ